MIVKVTGGRLVPLCPPFPSWNGYDTTDTTVDEDISKRDIMFTHYGPPSVCTALASNLIKNQTRTRELKLIALHDLIKSKCHEFKPVPRLL